ncbi:MAG: PhzF family phenazine biosynthesis protein [Candidatus Thorarchaeota archaeon]|nr:PhzF family phenazine biosynthesis protein [Candidatus Thorarchaeota archaeon]
MKNIPFVQTAVFFDKRYDFGGNQLATFWNADSNSSLSNEEMLGITREMNYSESTFVFQSKKVGCSAKVRIFTPGREIPFAGHPTLGTAFVLQRKKVIDAKVNKLRLELGLGPIEVEFLAKDLIRMQQKSPEYLEELNNPKQLLKALGLGEKTLSEDVPVQFVSTGNPFLIVPLKSLASVQKADPNGKEIIKALDGAISQDVLIFSTETIHSDSDAHARVFAPAFGVLEDPATGSAIGPLGAYLEHHDIIHTHTHGEVFTIEQGYEMNRPSKLKVQLEKRKQKVNVLVSGRVRATAEGNFYLKT